MIKLFVSFSYEGGFGNIELNASGEPLGNDDLVNIQQNIAVQFNIRNPIILFWKVMQ